ncbi:hypothetical protein [Mameliella alba]|uniref:hypothetical protein n=1 Tax=Mameliella alba TaxID=561184 RepID=UPI0005BDF080|nr:hypothetical protein [Mameliella alba]
MVLIIPFRPLGQVLVGADACIDEDVLGRRFHKETLNGHPKCPGVRVDSVAQPLKMRLPRLWPCIPKEEVHIDLPDRLQHTPKSMVADLAEGVVGSWTL